MKLLEENLGDLRFGNEFSHRKPKAHERKVGLH